jgi:hypothetical protein
LLPSFLLDFVIGILIMPHKAWTPSGFLLLVKGISPPSIKPICNLYHAV